MNNIKVYKSIEDHKLLTIALLNWDRRKDMMYLSATSVSLDLDLYFTVK
jgi:hypothetical protein